MFKGLLTGISVYALQLLSIIRRLSHNFLFNHFNQSEDEVTLLHGMQNSLKLNMPLTITF